jgi:formylglycine-generating enzyme
MARTSVVNLVATTLVTGALAVIGCKEKAGIAPEPGPTGPTELACPSGTAGGKQVLIPLADGTGYCIDQLEVTRGDYKVFLDSTKADTSGQPPECVENKSFEPPFEDPFHSGKACPIESWALDKYPDRPVVCVDFCDAYAYCAWAGKRLCGKVGASPKGIQVIDGWQVAQIAGTTSGEWSYACSQGGKTTYPYGDTYQPGACIDQARIDQEGYVDATLPKIEGETCHGTEAPFDQIYHLSGSVSEWLNLCDPTMFGCALFVASSGDVTLDKDATSCDAATTFNMHNNYQADLGFRCCASVPAAP